MKRAYNPKLASDVSATTADYLMQRLAGDLKDADRATLHTELTLYLEAFIYAYFDIPAPEFINLPEPSLN
jgi:hypothetical protein